MSAYEDLPSTIQMGTSGTMTFLHNEEFLSRVHIFADPGPEEFFAPPHWHERHDELFRVLSGRVEVLIGTEKRFYGPEDGVICIPKGAIHSVRVVRGEEAIFEERTEPMDEEKELFFRNLFALGHVHQIGFLDAMQVMYHGDGRPVLPLRNRWIEKTLVNVVGGYIAPLFGHNLSIPIGKKNSQL